MREWEIKERTATIFALLSTGDKDVLINGGVRTEIGDRVACIEDTQQGWTEKIPDTEYTVFRSGNQLKRVGRVYHQASNPVRLATGSSGVAIQRRHDFARSRRVDFDGR